MSQKPIKFMRQVVMRLNDGRSIPHQVEDISRAVAVPVYEYYGPDGPMFGQAIYTHRPGDMTVQGLPVYRNW